VNTVPATMATQSPGWSGSGVTSARDLGNTCMGNRSSAVNLEPSRRRDDPRNRGDLEAAAGCRDGWQSALSRGLPPCLRGSSPGCYTSPSVTAGPGPQHAEPIRTIPDPSRPLTHLRPLTTGRGVWDTISDVNAYELDLPSDERPTVSPPLVVPASFTCGAPIRTTPLATATILCWPNGM
jgi:hypothetical protein